MCEINKDVKYSEQEEMIISRDKEHQYQKENNSVIYLSLYLTKVAKSIKNCYTQDVNNEIV